MNCYDVVRKRYGWCVLPQSEAGQLTHEWSQLVSKWEGKHIFLQRSFVFTLCIPRISMIIRNIINVHVTRTTLIYNKVTYQRFREGNGLGYVIQCCFKILTDLQNINSKLYIQ